MAARVALLVSGASGMLLPVHFLAVLAGQERVERIHLVVSKGASQVLFHELGHDRTGAESIVEAAKLGARERAKVAIHRDNELDAPIASGSYRLAGTVILPASGGTVGALATGVSDTLIHRAGAVALKERWPLLLGFRETPLALVHLDNLRLLTLGGALVVPPIPAFYIGGQEMPRFLDAYSQRLLDHLGLGPDGPGLRWG
jgi:4-hydroxy-3-polyprenylbenzoate decarboxylase